MQGIRRVYRPVHFERRSKLVLRTRDFEIYRQIVLFGSRPLVVTRIRCVKRNDNGRKLYRINLSDNVDDRPGRRQISNNKRYPGRHRRRCHVLARLLGIAVYCYAQLYPVPVPASKDYTGTTQIADVVASDMYNVIRNDGGVNVGKYPVTFILNAAYARNYKWAGTEEYYIGQINPI
mgnify:CR=1 FL=1